MSCSLGCVTLSWQGLGESVIEGSLSFVVMCITPADFQRVAAADVSVKACHHGPVRSRFTSAPMTA
jgi:hypothetical protein